MAEDLINEYIDRNGIRGDTDYFLAALNEVNAALNKINSVKIDLGGGKGLSGTTQLFQQSKAGADSLAVAFDNVSKMQARLNGQTSELNRNTLLYLKAQKEAVNVELAQAKTIQQNIKNKQIQERFEKNITKEIERQNKARIKEEEQLAKNQNQYEQLKQRYTIAANSAKQLAAAKGLDNEETKEAIAVAQQYYNSLIKIEQAVGQNQRNVGNYTQATFALTQVLREAPAFANSFQTGISAISNNVPILTDQFKLLRKEVGSNFQAFKILAGSLLSFQAILPLAFLLIQSYAKEIKNFFSSLFGGARQITEVALAQEKLNDAMKSSEYKNAVVQVKELSTNIKLAKEGLIDKEKVLKIYNDTLGDSIGKAKSLDEAEQLLVKNGDAYIKVTLYKAAANIALNEAAEKSVQLAKDQLDPNARSLAVTLRRTEAEEKFGKQIRETAEYQRLLKEEGDAFNKQLTSRTKENIAAYERLKGSAKAFYEEQLNLLSGGKTSRDIQLLESVASTFQRQAAELAKQFNIDLFGGDGDNGTDKIKDNLNDVIKLLADARKQAFENYKLLIQDQIKAADQLLSSEQASYDERIAGLNLYYDANKKLIAAQRDFELDELDITTKQAIAAARKRGVEDKLSQQQITAEVNAIIEKSFVERKGINIRYNSEILDLDRDFYNKRIDILKYFNEKRAAEEKEYAEQIKKSIDDRFKRDIDNLNRLVKANQDAAKKNYETDKEYAERKKQLFNQLTQELIRLTESLLTGNIEREKNAIQGQIDLLEDKKQKDIEVANQTISNTEERAAAIQVIEARAAAQKEQLERRQRALDVEKAQFQKAAAIANIIQETAVGITRAIANLQPQLVPLIIGIGAAQLATVIAKPIPRYKHGKNIYDNYEGPAIVGDGGKQEAIIREDGSVEITDSKPQLTYVGSKDVVLPDVSKLVDYVLAGNMGGRLAVKESVPNESDQKLEQAMNLMRKDVVKAIKKIPQPVINVENVISKWIRSGDSSSHYLNR